MAMGAGDPKSVAPDHESLRSEIKNSEPARSRPRRDPTTPILCESLLRRSKATAGVAWLNIAKTEYNFSTEVEGKVGRKTALIHVKHWSNFSWISALQ